MSTKFEQLLDFIVNEEMDKANELFHEIVVEKSREIYENLIAEEEDLEVDESDEQEVDESDEQEVDEGNEELEDSYMMDSEEDEMGPPEATDDFGGDIGAMDDEEGPDENASPEEKVRFSIQQAMDELQAAFDAADDLGGGGDEFGDEEGSEFGDEEGGEFGDEEETDEMMGNMFEGRRLREYTEKVGNDWEKNSQKSQAQYAGAGTGDTEGAPVEGKSPIASGKNKPGPAGVGAGNIAQTADEGQSNTGTSPGKVNNGVTKTAGEKFASGNGNVPGGKMGVKNLSKVAGGHGAEKKGAGPGPVGSGTGDKAGQTSIDPATKRPFLKPYSR
jgi:hypothetical protein